MRTNRGSVRAVVGDSVGDFVGDVVELSVRDVVGLSVRESVQEDAPCGLEKPITKPRTTEQKGYKKRR